MNKNKLEREPQDGMIEYKRFLINLNKQRLEELSTQMKWRLNEGDNMAIYYLGVDDDGTIYHMTQKEKDETFKNFKLLVKMNQAKIVNITKINQYFKITIRKITETSEINNEVRIVLLGGSGSGKTTFLSNILLNKVTSDTYDSRIYMMNHKHELVTKKTSSYNCNYIIYNKTKYVFMEAPGSKKYIKMKYRILLGTHPNIILLFSDINNNIDMFDKFICETLNKEYNIPYIIINIFNTDSIYNCKKLINMKQLFTYIDNVITLDRTYFGKKTINMQFNVMNIYPHNDMGIVVSGFLVSGRLEINKQYNWLFNNMENSNIILKSIHVNSEPVSKVNGPMILTVCLQIDKPIKKGYKYGIITNIKAEPLPFILNIQDKFISFNNLLIANKCIGYIENKQINLPQSNDLLSIYNTPIIIDNIGIIIL